MDFYFVAEVVDFYFLHQIKKIIVGPANIALYLSTLDLLHLNN